MSFTNRYGSAISGSMIDTVRNILKPTSKPVVELEKVEDTTTPEVVVEEVQPAVEDTQVELPESVEVAEWGVGLVIPDTYNKETDTVDAIFEHGIEQGITLAEQRGRPKMARDKDGKIIRNEDGKGIRAKDHRTEHGATEGNNPEKEGGREHIMKQLEKAVTLKKHVEFDDGSKVKVHPRHAAKAVVKYYNSKPREKETLQKKLSSSHDSFLSAIGEK